MKLRNKLTLALLTASLLGAGMVGGVAYWLLMRDFREAVMEQAFHNFLGDAAAYVQTYGTWAEAERREPFPLFTQRRRAMLEDRPPRPLYSGTDLAGNLRSRPPFRFLLLDTDGRVMKEGDEYVVGQAVPDSLRRAGRPVEVAGQIIAYAVPLDAPTLSPQDLIYLTAMRRALMVGFVVAGLLAALLGMVFGRRMSAALDELTTAVRSMQGKGELRQQVPVRSRDEIGTLATAFNETTQELANAHDELRELSIRDPLTQLYNRRHFVEQVTRLFEQARRYNHPLSLMVGDLDHFKCINDTFSHSIGDGVLQRIGALMHKHTRKSDIAARHGGEEFVIVFAETPLETAVARCEVLRKAIEAEPWKEVCETLHVTMSMGVCTNTDEVTSIEEMLHIADQRLYAAKRDGRNRVVGDDAVTTEATA